jgi:hypothetical protein
MKTNYFNPTSKIIFSYLFLSFLITSSCKKETPESPSNEKSNFSSEYVLQDQSSQISNIINKSLSLQSKFDSNMVLGNNTFSIDSGLFYLQAVLNIKHSNLNVYEVESKRINLYRLYPNEGFTETTLKSEYTAINTLIQNELSNITFNDKAVMSIMVSKSVDEENQSANYFEVKVIVGRKTFQEQWLSKTYFDMFDENMVYRFNYNGGICGQNPYYAPIDAGNPRDGRWRDIEGDWHGFTFGAASLLEEALGQARESQYLLNNPLKKYTTPVGKKVIPIEFLAFNSLKPEYTVTTDLAQHPISQRNDINPTRILSYKDWSVNLRNKLPCINGKQLNYYLSEAVDISNDANYVNLSLVPNGMSYSGIVVHSNFYKSDQDTVKNNAKLSLETNNLNVEYFRHRYYFYATRVVLVTDYDAK